MNPFILILALLFASPILAQTSIGDWNKCAATPASAVAIESSQRVISRNGLLCYDFDADDQISGDFTTTFRATANTFSCCLETDRTASALGASILDIQVCNPNDPPTDNSCNDTGLQLSGSNRCEAMTRGRYRFHIITEPAGTEDAQIFCVGY